MSKRQHFTELFPILFLPFFLSLLPWWSLSLGGKLIKISHLVMGTHSLLNTWIIAHFKKKLLWQYRSQVYMYLEINLTTWPFRKITIASSTLGSINSPVIDLWWGLQCHAWMNSCITGLNSNQKSISYPYICHATIATLAGWYCSMYGPGLEKSLDVFSILQPILHSTSQHYERWSTKREFPCRFEIGFSCLTAKVCVDRFPLCRSDWPWIHDPPLE